MVRYVCLCDRDGVQLIIVNVVKHCRDGKAEKTFCFVPGGFSGNNFTSVGSFLDFNSKR